jgi:uncharacterized membrane protein YhhN
LTSRRAPGFQGGVQPWGIAAALIIGAAHIGARYRGAPILAGVLKAIPILLLVLLVLAEAVPVSERYRWLIAAALVCSMAGDIFLLFPGRFQAGLASFLAGHVLYVVAFAPPSGTNAAAIMTLVPFAAFAGGKLAFLWSHLGRDRLPVTVYVTVIATMGWRAAVRAADPATPSPSDVLAFTGALLFMASDSVLAYDRFVRRFELATAAVMTTYYAAQVLIALSVAR